MFYVVADNIESDDPDVIGPSPKKAAKLSLPRESLGGRHAKGSNDNEEDARVAEDAGSGKF